MRMCPLDCGFWRGGSEFFEVFSCYDMYGSFMHIVMTMGGSTSHLYWDSSGRRMAYISNLQVMASYGN